MRRWHWNALASCCLQTHESAENRLGSTELLTKALAQEARDYVKSQIAQVEGHFATVMGDVIAAAEASRRQTAVANDHGDAIQRIAKELAELREKNASLERRVSRQAEHLAKLEDERQRGR